ncbi:MAG: aminopeptidase P family protein [Clostridiales bacterium]|nr:aminopeptidase P family protein [Clostridiales bacterium]
MTGKYEKLAARLSADAEGALVVSGENRRYLTSFRSSAGAVLVLKEAAYFLTDFRYIEAAQRAVRGAECLRCRDWHKAIRELLDRHGITRLHIEGKGTTLAERDTLTTALPHTELLEKELDGWLQELRLIKEPAELACIREAQRLTDEAFSHILSYIRPGRTEREVALELELYIRRAGAEGASFDFIAVSGVNSSLPHGEPGDKPLEPGDFLTMDFGAVVDGWHSDMTRTVALASPGGGIGAEQRRVYDTVLQAQQAALSALRAGLPCAEGDAAARRVIEAAGYGEYFGHATGHGVGIEIHEAPRLSSSAGSALLQEGIVVTVEPGIYLPGKFGVRIEDMAVITADGCDNLTGSTKELLIL